MKSGIPDSCITSRYGTARRTHIWLLILGGALFAFSGCISLLKPFGTVAGVAFGAPLYLGEVSLAYHAENNRWPREFDELVAFCKEEDMMSIADIDEGKWAGKVDIDICMFKDVRFIPRPDGKLEIAYSFERGHPRTSGAPGEATVRMESASVIVSVPDDDVPCNGGKAGTTVEQPAKSTAPSSTPKSGVMLEDARFR